jgi:hypothetical protein
MSLICHRTRLKFRYVLSIVLGLSLGLLLSLVCVPLLSICDYSVSIFSQDLLNLKLNNNESVRQRNRLDSQQLLARPVRSLSDKTLVDYTSQDYEPEIRPLPSSNISSSISLHTNKKNAFIRPRYIADELGIKEKVLAAVFIDEKHLHTFGIFHNQTLHEHIDRLLFFVDNYTKTAPTGMQVMILSDQRAHLKPFYVLKYLAENMIDRYDWFLLIPHNAFIRGFKVSLLYFILDTYVSNEHQSQSLFSFDCFTFEFKEFLQHISINQDLYLGQAFDDTHAVYCSFGSGIILSGVSK